MVASAVLRVGVGTRVVFDGELLEVAEVHTGGAAGAETVLRACTGRGPIVRVSLRELLDSERARLVAADDGISAADDFDSADTIVSALPDVERSRVTELTGHIREVLTGYSSGTAESAKDDEPRPAYVAEIPITTRYQSKADELAVSRRTIEQWVADFRRHGEAGLARSRRHKPLGLVDQRWIDMAVEVIVEYENQSRPSRAMVIKSANARVVARYGPGVVQNPSRATAYRVLEQLEQRHPTFRLSTKRNRDIADRPGEAYGKLRPSRPGEYMLMDTTRLDVFALDPLTLRWVQAELTVGMDWYTRCITGIRVTPVSTKSVDAAAVLYQAYRPRPAGTDWPERAVWPEHGVPRSVLVETESIDESSTMAASPAIVPDTIVIDHGKIYVSEHLTSVCQRMGISIQPARLRTGRDKGPVERFFRTIREDLLQALPGYKGPDVHSRGLNPESEAFFYLDELEDIVREWVAADYHHRPHDSLVEPKIPSLRMSPAQKFDEGIARAGYIEAPRDPDLAYEFLKTHWRKVQHYGVDIGGRRYNGPALNSYRNLTSSHAGKAKGRWPIHCNPDDITRVYFRDPQTRAWHTLRWEHAPEIPLPLSEDALHYARKLAASKYTYPDDQLALEDLLERRNLGLGSSRRERRIALRLSREATDLDALPQTDEITSMPSVARVLAASESDDVEPVELEQEAEDGDDDSEDDVDDFEALVDTDDFYADALEDA